MAHQLIIFCYESVFFTYVHLQVATSGYLLFGRRVASCCISTFENASSYDYIVAPFLSNIDTNMDGEIAYEVHSNTSSPGVLAQYSSFIRLREDAAFYGTWMIIAEWKKIPLFAQSSEMVS